MVLEDVKQGFPAQVFDYRDIGCFEVPHTPLPKRYYSRLSRYEPAAVSAGSPSSCPQTLRETTLKVNKFGLPKFYLRCTSHLVYRRDFLCGYEVLGPPQLLAWGDSEVEVKAICASTLVTHN